MLNIYNITQVTSAIEIERIKTVNFEINVDAPDPGVFSSTNSAELLILKTFTRVIRIEALEIR